MAEGQVSGTMAWNATDVAQASLYWNPGAISYLVETILALVLSGYLAIRAAREIRQSHVHAATLLLTVLMLAISLTFLASMVRVLTAGGWVSYAMPWSRTDAWTTLAMPWSRPFGGIVSAALIVLAYQFPKPLEHARTEMKIVGTGLVALVAIEVVIAVKADLAMLSHEAWWRPQWIAGWMNIAMLGAAFIFWRQLAAASGDANAPEPRRRIPGAVAALWRRAPNRDAEVARAFLIFTMLPLVHTTALFLPDESQFGRYPLDIFICWSALAQLVAQFDVRQNFLFMAALNVPVGPAGSEYGGIESPIDGKYFSSGPGLFAQLAWYF